MSKASNIIAINVLRDIYSRSDLWIFLIDYSGMNAQVMFDLRVKLKRSEAAANMVIAKNRLNKIAVSGTSFDLFAPNFTGPLATVYCTEPVILAKILHEYVVKKKIKLVVYGNNAALYDGDTINTLASLPSMSLLRAQLLSVLLLPITAFMRAAVGVQRNLVIVLDTVRVKNSN